ncbi:DegT/DnrJ/EryC1/StrS family aminotransferase [Candidatus Sumerlaeota bacterium]|nr:DegT/DnrJ/EryC1/StrS family aminotransferase [Candidatus Sumerlaeota bacterium]
MTDTKIARTIPWAIPDIQEEDVQNVQKVLASGWFTMGKETRKFEESLEKYLHVRHAIAVNNGTAALDVALKCLNIGYGDEVIVPVMTYIATANIVRLNYGKPVFADIDETLNLNPESVEGKISPKTKAVISVDLGGNPADYENLIRITRKHNLSLIVDGAQSLGASFDGKKCCSHGIINTTSFHAAKILTTIEGGMLFTDDDRLDEIARAIRNQGETDKKYFHAYLGANYRMMDIIAAFGQKQIERFEDTLARRKKLISIYKQRLQGLCEFPRTLEKAVNSFFLLIILVDRRDELVFFLKRHGVDTRIAFPLLIHQPVYGDYGDETFPVAENLEKKVLSLPLYSKLKEDDIHYICDLIAKFSGEVK